MRINLLYFILIVANRHNVLLVSANKDNEKCTDDRKLDNECGAYTYRVVKPVLTHFRTLSDEIAKKEAKDSEIKDLKEKLAQLEQELSLCHSKTKDKEMIIAKLESEVSFDQKTITRLLTQSNTIYNYDHIQKELTQSSGELKLCEYQLGTLNSSYTKVNKESQKLKDDLNIQLSDSKKELTQTLENLNFCKSEVKKLNVTTENAIPSSCIPFKYSSGVHKITCRLETIHVLCDSQTVGDGVGWIVIQQRIDGKEDFYRNWNTYRKGFGSYVGDFFIGLEKLHQLTNSTQQELYIQLTRFNGKINYARYDNFKVGSEEEDYKLISLGTFSSNGVVDYLRIHENMKFSTSDRDNDNSGYYNCPHDHQGGWWYNYCTGSNLNGKYLNVKLEVEASVYWERYSTLKEVKMLIRPKYN